MMIAIIALAPLSLAAQSTDFLPSVYITHSGYYALMIAEISEGKILSEPTLSTWLSIYFRERNYNAHPSIDQPIFLYLGLQAQAHHAPFNHWRLVLYDNAALARLMYKNLSFETASYEYWLSDLTTRFGLTLLDIDRTVLRNLDANWFSVSTHLSGSFANDPMIICGTPMKGAPRLRIPEYFFEGSLEAVLSTVRLGSEHYTGIVLRPDDAIIRPTVQATVSLGAGLKEILQFLTTASARYFFTRDNLLLVSLAGQFYWSVDEDWPQIMLSLGREFANTSLGYNAYTTARVGLSIKVHQLPFR